METGPAAVQAMLLFIATGEMTPDTIINSPYEATHLISFPSGTPAQKTTFGDAGGTREFQDVNSPPKLAITNTPEAEKIVTVAKTSRLKIPAYGPEAAESQRLELDPKSPAIYASPRELQVIHDRIGPLIFADIEEAITGCPHTTLLDQSRCPLCGHQDCAYLNRPGSAPFFSPFVAVRRLDEDCLPVLPPATEPVIQDLRVDRCKFYHPANVIMGGKRGNPLPDVVVAGLPTPPTPLAIEPPTLGVPRASSTQRCESQADSSFSAGFPFASSSSNEAAAATSSSPATTSAVTTPTVVVGGKRPSTLSPIPSDCDGDFDCDDSRHIIKFSRSQMRPFLSSNKGASATSTPAPAPASADAAVEIDLTQMDEAENDFTDEDFGVASTPVVKVEAMEAEEEEEEAEEGEEENKENAGPSSSSSKGDSFVTPKANPRIARSISLKVDRENKALRLEKRRQFERGYLSSTTLNFDDTSPLDFTRDYSPVRTQANVSTPSSPIFDDGIEDDDGDLSLCPEQQSFRSVDHNNSSGSASIFGAFSPLS